MCRQVSDRREASAGPQLAILDLLLDAGDDLFDQRSAITLADGEREHVGISFGPELAWYPDRYSAAK
jgi:hypothetical protein